jgi:hypothetical protein
VSCGRTSVIRLLEGGEEVGVVRSYICNTLTRRWGGGRGRAVVL